jgi:hypothetical protein
VYEGLYEHFRRIYFAFGQPGKSEFSQVLPDLIEVAKAAHATGA